MKFLRSLRFIIAILMIIISSAFFMDIYSILPKWFFKMDPTHMQYAPSLMMFVGAGVLGLSFVFFTVLSIFFGRVYCSFVCPFGISMDIMRRIMTYPAKNKFLKNTKVGKFVKKSFATLKFEKAFNRIRAFFFILGISFYILGLSAWLGFIEPFSLFGKMMTNFVRPLTGFINDQIYFIFARFEYYDVIPLVSEKATVTAVPLIVGTMIFGFILILSAFRGRLYCNTICPVGAWLGLLSKFSLFKLTIKKSKCISCGLCEKNCKAQCINSKEKTIDFTRCVSCFDCIDECKKNAISYEFSKQLCIDKCNIDNGKKSDGEKMNRRDFSKNLAGFVAVVGTGAKEESLSKDGQFSNPKKITIPPGAKTLDNFRSQCIGCLACTNVCKGRVLKPSTTAWGLSGFMQPYMDFHSGFCIHECHECTKVCPTGAIEFLTSKEKMNTKIGTAIFYEDLCVVKTDETDCGACGEHCPVQAIEMIKYGNKKDALYIPKVHENMCIGCGACENVCPVRPKRAIIIEGLNIHGKAKAGKQKRERKRGYDKDNLVEPNKKIDKRADTSGDPFPF